MAEFIEREALLKSISIANPDIMADHGPEYGCEWGFSLDAVKDIVVRAPSADVAPVVHSRFVNMGGFPACKHCGASPGVWEPKPGNPSGFPPYCYACGAKMDEDINGGAMTI